MLDLERYHKAIRRPQAKVISPEPMISPQTQPVVVPRSGDIDLVIGGQLFHARLTKITQMDRVRPEYPGIPYRAVALGCELTFDAIVRSTDYDE